MIINLNLESNYDKDDKIYLYNEGKISILAFYHPMKLLVGPTIYQEIRYYELKVEEHGEITIKEIKDKNRNEEQIKWNP